MADEGPNLAKKSENSSPDDFSYSGEYADEANEALSLIPKHLSVADRSRVHTAPKCKLQTLKGSRRKENGISLPEVSILLGGRVKGKIPHKLPHIMA